MFICNGCYPNETTDWYHLCHECRMKIYDSMIPKDVHHSRRRAALSSVSSMSIGGDNRLDHFRETGKFN